MAILLLINLHYEQTWTYECKRKKLVWHDEAIRRGADIQVQIAVGTLSTVEGYGPEIREVLTNLIFNAVDAMPHGGTLRFNGRRIPRLGGRRRRPG